MTVSITLCQSASFQGFIYSSSSHIERTRLLTIVLLPLGFFFFPHRYKAKCVSAYVIMGWCSLQNLEREQKNRVAEWPFKVGIMATRGPLAKTARTRQPGGTAVKG